MASLTPAPVSVTTWLAHLSPEAMAQYYFTSYDSLLSHSAMQLLLTHDFETEGRFGLDSETVANLRLALGQLYEGNTCELRRDGSKHVLSITVPSGSLTTWPPQIPQPDTISYPTPPSIAQAIQQAPPSGPVLHPAE